jgi:hypothetical protein
MVPALVSFGLLLLTYFFALWYVDPWARYISIAPVFLYTRDYYAPFFRRPGGLSEYAASFLAQLDFYPRVGALVLVMLMLLVAVSAWRLLPKSRRALGPVWTLPPILLLGLYQSYAPNVLQIGLELLFALSLAGIYVHTANRGPAGALWAGFGAGLLFYVAGPAATLVFIAIAAIHCLWAGILAAPWLLAVLMFGGWRESALATALQVGTTTVVLAIAAYAVVPALRAFDLLLARRSPPGEPLGRTPKAREPGGASFTWQHAAGYVAIALMALATLVLTFSPRTRALLKIQAEAERGNWPGVLEAADGLDLAPMSARLQIQRALFHTGRLNDVLFSYPHRAGVDLLASLSDGLEVCVPMSDTLLELGHINLAERYAHEILEMRGEVPGLLWRLARVNLIKERPLAARVFLNRLAKVPFQRPQSERWLAAIDRDATCASEPEILEARLRRVTLDHVERRFATDQLLRALLRPDRPNPMAAEYLMAFYLLARQPDQLARSISLLPPDPTRVLPKHLSEALLAQQPNGSTLPSSGWRADPEVRDRFAQFTRALQNANTPAGQAELAGEFGNTYWFFHVLGFTAPASAKHAFR